MCIYQKIFVSFKEYIVGKIGSQILKDQKASVSLNIQSTKLALSKSLLSFRMIVSDCQSESKVFFGLN